MSDHIGTAGCRLISRYGKGIGRIQEGYRRQYGRRHIRQFFLGIDVADDGAGIHFRARSGNVRTVMIGRAPGLVVLFMMRSQQSSVSDTTVAAMTLEASIVEPPPTARMTSMPSSRQIWTPLLTVVWCGFGSTPPSSEMVMPAFFRMSTTLS